MPVLGRMKTLIPARPEKELSGGRKLRHELKYIIDEGTYRVLLARLSPLMYRERRISGDQPLLRRYLRQRIQRQDKWSRHKAKIPNTQLRS